MIQVIDLGGDHKGLIVVEFGVVYVQIGRRKEAGGAAVIGG